MLSVSRWEKPRGSRRNMTSALSNAWTRGSPNPERRGALIVDHDRPVELRSVARSTAVTTAARSSTRITPAATGCPTCQDDRAQAWLERALPLFAGCSVTDVPALFSAMQAPQNLKTSRAVSGVTPIPSDGSGDQYTPA